MRRLRLLALAISVLALTAALAASATRPALALGTQIRTFVASTGSDTNPCTRTAPCRLFSAALAQTANGGEIVALDTGGYGALTITQPVTVLAAPGVRAFISPSSGAAITVNAGAGDAVVLRNLTLNGQGATYGVDYLAGGGLHVEDLSINGFSSIGIRSGGYQLYVADTVVRGSGSAGIYLYAANGTASATILRARLERNGYGLDAHDNVRASVSDTVASGNNAYGFSASSQSAPVELNLEGCIATGNSYAIVAYSVSNTATVRASNCTVTDNYYGVLASTNGTILSRSNNTVEGNNFNGAFTGTYTAK